MDDLEEILSPRAPLDRADSKPGPAPVRSDDDDIQDILSSLTQHQAAATRPESNPANPAPSMWSGLDDVPLEQAHVPAKPIPQSSGTAPADPIANHMLPTGWLVTTDGPGVGSCLTLTGGLQPIRVRGDAPPLLADDPCGADLTIAYDADNRSFFIGPLRKQSIIRLNGEVLLSTHPLASGSTISVAGLTLRFAAFCDSVFGWPADTGP